MNEIDKKETPDVSGGYRPDQGGCFPIGPFPIGPAPIGPIGEPFGPGYPQCPSAPIDPTTFVTDPPSV